MNDYFGKGCKYLCGKGEPDDPEKEGVPLINCCTHLDNPDKQEGSCNLKHCPLDKLCGCKETCFKRGGQWGHFEGVMCHYLYEERDENGCFTNHCHKTKEKVAMYTTQKELDELLKERSE